MLPGVNGLGLQLPASNSILPDPGRTSSIPGATAGCRGLFILNERVECMRNAAHLPVVWAAHHEGGPPCCP